MSSFQAIPAANRDGMASSASCIAVVGDWVEDVEGGSTWGGGARRVALRPRPRPSKWMNRVQGKDFARPKYVPSGGSHFVAALIFRHRAAKLKIDSRP